jgi:PIN domain
MFVVFDTNIWLENLYLKSPAGAAARFFILQKGAQVALPEVVRLEIEHHLRNDLRKSVALAREGHNRLLALFGSLKEIVLPNDEEIEGKISSIVGSLGFQLIEIPFSLESARSSLLRTIDKIPPSVKSQQFKDGVLWADCLTLLKSDDVVLVTGDTDFFEQHQYASGLAELLKQELKSFPHKLTILPKLTNLLAEMRTKIRVDHEALTSAFLKIAGGASFGILENNGFERGERISVETQLFITEDPNLLFVEFEIGFQCIDVIGSGGRQNAAIVVKGDGTYDCRSMTFSRLGELGSVLRFRDVDQTEQERRSIVARMEGVVLGHADISHTIRRKLD